MISILLIVNWLSGLLAALPAGRQLPEPGVRFEIVNAGFTVKGTFSGLTTTGEFDPARLAQAHIQATVPVRTVHTGIGLRDQHLQKPDYFDAAQFPLITMQSTAFRAAGGGQYEGTFRLTIKGISHEVKLPFTLSAARELRGSFRLNRLDYDLGKTSLVLANDVLVSVNAPLPAAP